MDPVRFRFMEALERRAAPHAGAARALLDQRLAALLDAYAADLERDEAAPGSPRPSRRKRLAARRRIAAADTPIDAPCPPTPWPAWPARSTPATPCLARRLPGAAAAGRVPRYLGQGQCNRQLRQSEQQVPDNAGPLNPNNLVHSRSLARDALCRRWRQGCGQAAKPAAAKRAAGQDGLTPRPICRPVPAVRYDPYTNHIRITYMGIVKISEQMHENLRVASAALSRSINSQAEHWMRIGMLSELYPQLRHADICQLLIRIEQAEGFSIAALSQGQPQDAHREAA